HSQAQSYKSQLCDIKQLTDSAAVYLQRAKSLADRLAALNEPVSEADLIHYILRGLATPYKAFTRSIRHRQVPPSYTELHGLILTEELELAAEESASSAGPAFSHFAGRSRGDRRLAGRSHLPHPAAASSSRRPRPQPYLFPGPPAHHPGAGPPSQGPMAYPSWPNRTGPPAANSKGLLPLPQPGRQAHSTGPSVLFLLQLSWNGPPLSPMPFPPSAGLLCTHDPLHLLS
ncbi:hypothetical protein LINPERPRIM_LOCUS21290, partial [Linum perenne]